MLSRALRTIQAHRLLGGEGDDARVLVAVSGGPDSMALLAVLWELGPRLGLALEVATVDHGLRAGAAAEQALVAERAAALGLPFHLLRVDVPGARAARAPGGAGRGGGGGGIQETARRLRLGALEALAARRRLGRIALGHQADDQAETVLFRILRGTGLAGLGGIPYDRGPFVRPLLDVTRAEILGYLRRRSIPFAADPSNDDLRFARVRLRRQILPLLRQENPRLDRALRELAAAARDADGRAAGRALLSAAAAAPVYARQPTLARIAEAARAGQGTRAFDVAGGRVTVTYGRVGFTAGRAPDAPPAAASAQDLTLAGPGDYPFGAAAIVRVREERPAAADGPADARWVWFDGDRLGWPLSVRPRRAGDRMRPRAGRGSRKLSDLLIDAKVPRARRASLPVVVAADGEVLLVPGLRPSAAAAPTAATRRRIGIAIDLMTVSLPGTIMNSGGHLV